MLSYYNSLSYGVFKGILMIWAPAEGEELSKREANLMIILIYYRQSLVSNSLGLEPLLFTTVARTASVAVVLKNGWEAE